MHTSRGWTLNLNWSDKKSEDKELTPLFWNKFSASDFSRVVHCLFPTYLAHFLPLAITITTTSWCSLLRRVLLFLWGGWGERKRARGARYEGWKLPRALSIFSIIAIFSGIPSGKLCGGEFLMEKSIFIYNSTEYGGVFEQLARYTMRYIHSWLPITRTLANSNLPLTDFPWISFITLL